MADTLDAAKASLCYAADTCVLDEECPFAATCQAAEAAYREDED